MRYTIFRFSEASIRQDSEKKPRDIRMRTYNIRCSRKSFDKSHKILIFLRQTIVFRDKGIDRYENPKIGEQYWFVYRNNMYEGLCRFNESGL